MTDEPTPVGMGETPPGEATLPDTFEAPPAEAPGEPTPADTPEAPPGDTPDRLFDDEGRYLPALSNKGVIVEDPDRKLPTKPPPNPWERQVGETHKAYRAFEVYRAMDPEERSLKRMSEIEQKRVGRDGKERVYHPYSWTVITNWSRKNGWVSRSNAWDIEVSRRTSNRALRDAEKTQDRHRDLARMMQSRVAERLSGMQAAELGRRDIDRWLKTAILIERQALGLDRTGSAGDAPQQNINVGVGFQFGQPQPVKTDAQVQDETPIGEYLMKNPGDVSKAVGSIQELLALVGSGESEAKGG